ENRRYKNEGGERQKARWRSKFAATEERPGEINRATSAGRGGATEDEAPHSSPLSASGASVLAKFSKASRRLRIWHAGARSWTPRRSAARRGARGRRRGPRPCRRRRACP